MPAASSSVLTPVSVAISSLSTCVCDSIRVAIMGTPLAMSW
jgi:hypothetical protein